MTLEPPQDRTQSPAPLAEGDLDEMFRTAIQAHSDGRLEEAEEIYRRILQVDSKQPHALHLLGVIAYQAGQAESAVQLISQAIALLGNIPDFHNNIGEAYRSLGRYDEAITHYRRALTLEPVNPGAACNMGSALIAQGKIHDAIAAYKKALGFKPDFAEAKAKLGAALVRLPKDDPERDLDRGIGLLREGLRVNPAFTEGYVNLANALADKGEMEEAIGLYRQAIERDPDNAQIQLNLAVVLFEADQIDEGREALSRALALGTEDTVILVRAGEEASLKGFRSTAILCFQRAAELAPEMADAHEHLARALHQNTWHKKAIESYRRVLEIEPGRWDVRMSLCNCLSQNQRTEQALTMLEEMLQEKPDDIDLLNLVGRTLQREGRFEEAVPYFLRACDLDPSHPGAYYNLADDRNYEMSDTEIRHLRELAADESLDAEHRTVAHFALGPVLHRKEDYDAAFAHYAKGNELVHERKSVSLEALWSELDSAVSVFDSAFFEKRWAHGDDSDRPVFVVGMPRSGTTLTERILAGHPEVAGGGELPGLPWIANFMQTDIKSTQPYPWCLPEIDPATARGFARHYLDGLDEVDSEAQRVIDKLPGNCVRIGLIGLLFPNAKVIHLERDPLDTCLSCYFQLFRRDFSYMWDLRDIAAVYKQYRRYMEHWHAVRPIEILDVQYEDLVADPEPVARRMIDFIGLDWDPRCLDSNASDQPIATASIWQARQPIYDSSVAGWKHYEKHLGPLIEALED